MKKNALLSGTIHELPFDMEELLFSKVELSEIRNSLTPIARDEWICRVTIVKKAETRTDHLKRLGEDLMNGKRRPCCRPGCPHRRPDAQKWFQKRVS